MKTRQQWLRETYKGAAERPARFSTVSDMELEPAYGPEDVSGDFQRDIGYPGEYPYTRGVYSSMYRGRLWT
ncbi:MAG TPA: methylmalonyl-CoA mutase family protein, partial [Candidatus Binataceae bacterium]